MTNWAPSVSGQPLGLGALCSAGGCDGTGIAAKGLEREKQNLTQPWNIPAPSWVFDNKLLDELRAVQGTS